jgi:group II intron reverse transcriptase/maturase
MKIAIRRKEGITQINNILKKIREKSERGETEFKDLYSLIEEPSLAKWATGKLLKNKGIDTPGVDKERIDGLNIEKIEKISLQLKEGKYEPQPTRRVLIPKPGKKEKRPLGIPSFQDKVVQQMIYEILEAIYEPVFDKVHQNKNYGFRRGYRIKDAMGEIKRRSQNTRWCIEGDIKGAYDNVQHPKMIRILEERIKDKRLIKLIKRILESGIMKENGKREDSIIGTPQGGIISPILFNIYMSKLDEKIIEMEKEQEMRNKKEGRKIYRNKEYEKVSSRMSKIAEWIKKKEREHSTVDMNKWPDEDRREGMKRMKELKEKGLERMKMNSLEESRLPLRMVYIRYADDWVIYLNGEKERAIGIKHEICTMLKEELGLELNEDKTKITDLKTQKVNFLGFRMGLPRGKHPKKKGTLGRVKRTANHQLRIGVDEDRLRKRLTINGFLRDGEHTDKVISKVPWTVKSDQEIIRNYNWLIRGLIAYWSQGVDFYYVTRRYVGWIRLSAKLTLAHKRRTNRKGIEEMYGKEITTDKDSKETNLITFEEAREMFYRLKEKEYKETKEVKVYTNWRTIQRLSEKCTICGSSEKLELHHVNKIKNLKKKEVGFKRIMIQLNRSWIQIVVCKKCHDRIHTGQYDGIKMSDIDAERKDI